MILFWLCIIFIGSYANQSTEASTESTFDQRNALQRYEELLKHPDESNVLHKMVNSKNFLSLHSSDNAHIIPTESNHDTIHQWKRIYLATSQSQFLLKKRKQFNVLSSVMIDAKVYDVEFINTQTDKEERFLESDALDAFVNELVKLEWDVELKAILRFYKKRVLKNKDSFIQLLMLFLRSIHNQILLTKCQISKHALDEFMNGFFKHLSNYSQRHADKDLYSKLYMMLTEKGASGLLTYFDPSKIPIDIQKKSLEIATKKLDRKSYLILKRNIRSISSNVILDKKRKFDS